MSESALNRKLSREERSKVLKFNDKTLERLEEYEFTPLKDQKRRIRLLRLISSGLENPLIDCELFEVEFNDKYIPTRVHPEVDSNDQGERVDYEALSWCWGKETLEYAIRIRDEDDVQYKMSAKRELVLALKYLRRPHRDRIIWIDAICIDQANHQERNHQVQMMSMIYTRAEKVCVWLGEDDSDSNMAITFITNEIMHLERFDSICKNKANADKWQALLTLMQRPWFRRRWVVQEIALSRRAKVYCGGDKIPWKDFAVAVELFVEVESATHRLSEVMQKDERFFHVPGWFEYVSQLGASLLVDATGKVFRSTEIGRDEAADVGRMWLSSGVLVPKPLQLRKRESRPDVQKAEEKGPGSSRRIQSDKSGKLARKATVGIPPGNRPQRGCRRLEAAVVSKFQGRLLTHRMDPSTVRKRWCQEKSPASRRPQPSGPTTLPRMRHPQKPASQWIR